MKMKTIFSAALAAALIAVPRAQAVTGGTVATNATADAATSTNAKPVDLVANLFGDPVITKGNGFEIKQSQLDAATDAFRSRLMANGQSLPPSEVTRMALNSLIVNQLLLQQANDADKAEGKKDADEIVARAIKTYGSQAGVEQQLKAAGKTFDSWRSDYAQQGTATAALIRILNAAPTEAEIARFYETNSSGSQLPEMVHVRHILLLTVQQSMDPQTGRPTMTPLPDDQVKAKRKQIDDLLKQARGGADFADLAKKYSEDPGTKDSGGELPPFARAKDDPAHPMVPEFESAAFALTNHQISDVVTSQFGYHIIQLIDKTPARKLALTDKVPPSDTVTLSDEIKDWLTREKLQLLAPPFIDKLSKTPGVEILDPALKTLMADTNAPAASGLPAAK